MWDGSSCGKRNGFGRYYGMMQEEGDGSATVFASNIIASATWDCGQALGVIPRCEGIVAQAKAA